MSKQQRGGVNERSDFDRALHPTWLTRIDDVSVNTTRKWETWCFQQSHASAQESHLLPRFLVHDHSCRLSESDDVRGAGMPISLTVPGINQNKMIKRKFLR